jgi:hypothetical protein
MAKDKKSIINVKGKETAILQKHNSDFISLTDMVKGFGDDTMIYSWMRNRNILAFLGIWEQMNNPDFKGNEFVTFNTQAGPNSFNLTTKKWIEASPSNRDYFKGRKIWILSLADIEGLRACRDAETPVLTFFF